MQVKPIKIEEGEWLFMGCFIQKQPRPSLPLYHIFQDNEEQVTVGTSYTFIEAKKIAMLNKVDNPIHSASEFL